MNNWLPESAPSLIRLEGTDLWTLAAEYEPDARLDYRFLVNGADWRLDPLNPRTMVSGQGPNSELVMPEYVQPQELGAPDREIPAGSLDRHTLTSDYLNQTRTFFVYTPAGQMVGQKPPTVYIQDGGDYLNLIDATTILDRLIADRQVPPLVAVFIPPINRNEDYGLNDDYAGFLADELTPLVQQTYDTDPDPARTGVIGPSLGGLAAIHAALSRPEVFGRAAGQSGAYSVDGDALIRLAARQRSGLATRPPVRFYLVVGTYETAVGGDEGSGNYLEANRRLANTLVEIDQEVLFEERHEGHSWGLWRATLGRALAYLFND
jgi:enterochelin esterase family protein